MSGQARNFNLKFGKHSSTSDLTATPGTLIQLAPESHGFVPPERIKIERKAQTAGARFLGSIAGPLELAEYSLEQVVRGMSGNAGGAVDAEASSEIGSILDVIFGGDSTDPSGSGGTVAGGTGSTPTLIVSSGTNFAAGQAVLFPTSVATHAREIVSVATDTLTLDRDYSGTPSNGTTTYRAPYWKHDLSIIEHKHGYFDAEGSNYRRIFKGCMGKGSLKFAINDYVRLMTSWKATDVADSAEANPTYTEATAGDALLSVNSYFYVGDQAYTFHDLSVDFGGSVTPRNAHNGVNGVHGYGVFDKAASISGKLYVGDNSSLGDIDDSSTTPLNVNIGQAFGLTPGDAITQFDIAIQVGNTPGSCMYIRAPACEFSKFAKTTVDGFDAYDFTLSCKSPATGSPFRLHLF